MKIASATLVLALVSSAPALAASSGDEIREALVGNSFQGGMGGGQYSSYFAEDGTYRDGSGSGRYTIENDGVCYPDTEFGCYQAEIEGDQLEWFQDGKSQGTGRILEGNALGF